MSSDRPAPPAYFPPPAPPVDSPPASPPAGPLTPPELDAIGNLPSGEVANLGDALHELHIGNRDARVFLNDDGSSLTTYEDFEYILSDSEKLCLLDTSDSSNALLHRLRDAIENHVSNLLPEGPYTLNIRAPSLRAARNELELCGHDTAQEAKRLVYEDTYARSVWGFNTLILNARPGFLAPDDSWTETLMSVTTEGRAWKIKPLKDVDAELGVYPVKLDGSYHYYHHLHDRFATLVTRFNAYEIVARRLRDAGREVNDSTLARGVLQLLSVQYPDSGETAPEGDAGGTAPEGVYVRGRGDSGVDRHLTLLHWRHWASFWFKRRDEFMERVNAMNQDPAQLRLLFDIVDLIVATRALNGSSVDIDQIVALGRVTVNRDVFGFVANFLREFANAVPYGYL